MNSFFKVWPSERAVSEGLAYARKILLYFVSQVVLDISRSFFDDLF